MKRFLPVVTLLFTSLAASAQDNGLSPADRKDFYHLAEGSEVIPLELLRPLYSSATHQPFLQNMERFGLIPDNVSSATDNPEGLPIGVTAAPSRDTRMLGNFKMVGINCSACHVNQITFQGKKLLIDGAPNRFDIEAFFNELATSVKATLDDKFELIRYLQRLATGHQFILGGTSQNFLLSVPHLDRTEKMTSLDASVVSNLEKIVEEERAKAAPSESSFLQGFKRKDERTIVPAERVPAPTVEPPHLSPEVEKPLHIFSERLMSEPTNFTTLAHNNPFSSLTGIIGDIRTAIGLLQARLAFLQGLARDNLGGATPGLHGRTDAFGHARVFIFGAAGAPPINAPVDYPSLWGFNQLTWVHWDGNTNSVLERNIGQALGLGAVFTPDYSASTVILRNLHQLETIARNIKSPKWPEDLFPKLAADKITRGKALFEKRCASCHDENSDGSGDLPSFSPQAIGTDPNRITSFGTKLPSGQLFSDALAKVLHALKVSGMSAEGVSDAELAWWEGPNRTNAIWRTTNKYVARPLHGIWASAPYLHNGSVATLNELLQSNRGKTSFRVGQREFDPINVGYADVPAAPSAIEEYDVAATGNANTGHIYTDLAKPDEKDFTDAERMDLIEYLKSL